jgi:hypothetical protein
MGPCNLNGQHRRLTCTYCFHHYSLCRQNQNSIPKHSFQCMYHPKGVLTHTTLRILTTMNTSNPVPKIITNWNVDGNITLGKLNNRIAVYFLHSIYYHIIFPPTVYNVIYYIKKNWRNKTIFNINTRFAIRTTYVELLLQFYHKETSILIVKWNSVYDYEDLGKTVQEVRFRKSYSLTEWQSQQHKLKHTYFTEVSLFVYIILNTLTCLSYLGKVFTIVMAQIKFLYSSCCRIGDLPTVVSLAQK